MVNRKQTLFVLTGVVVMFLTTACGKEWLDTKCVIRPVLQKTQGGQDLEPIPDRVEMGLFYVKDTVGWYIASKEDAVAQVIKNRETEEVKNQADLKPDVVSLITVVFESVKGKTFILTAYDRWTEQYAYKGVVLQPNLHVLYMTLTFNDPSWNKQKYYTKNGWMIRDPNIKDTPEGEE